MNQADPGPISASPLTHRERWVIAGLVAVTGGLAASGFVIRSVLPPQSVLQYVEVAIAPSTAICLLLLAVAEGLWLWWGVKDWARRVIGTVAGCVAGAGLGFSIWNTLHPFSDWDRTAPLFSEAVRAGTAGTSPMAPVTGIMLALLAGALSILAMSPVRQARLRALGLAAAASLCALGIASVLGQAAGYSAFVATGKFHVAPLTATVITLQSLALALEFGLRTRLHYALLDLQPQSRAADTPREHRLRWTLDLGVVTTCVVMSAAGYLYLRTQLQERRRQLDRELSSVAELKISQITAWRVERLADIRAFTQTPHLAEFLETPASTADDTRFPRYFENIVRNHSYRRLVIYDAQFNARLALPKGPLRSIPPDIQQALPLTHEVLVGGFLRTPDDELSLDLFAPVRSVIQDRMVGAIRISIDLRTLLFPQICQWPTRSNTGEVLLLQANDSSVTYLNQRRFDATAARSAGTPVDRLGAQTAREGEFGLTDSRDYRGAAVLAVAHPVPGTPWILLAKMDQQEAYAPLFEEVRQFVYGLGLVVFASGALLSYLWRSRQRDLSLRHQESERARQAAVERLGLVLQNANDIILLLDEEMRIVEANDQATLAYGMPLAELKQLSAQDLRSDGGDSRQSDYAAVKAGHGQVFESVHRHKDGRSFPVEISARPVILHGQQHVLSIVRDISERKAAQSEIERVNGLYRVLTRISQAIAHSTSQEELFRRSCESLVEFSRFKIAWIGHEDPTTHWMVVDASAGDDYGYLTDIRVSTDPTIPEGRGPSGIVYRTGQLYVANDFFADTGTQPWRAKAARSGLKASICLALHRGGTTFGILTVYAAESGFFGAREIALLTEAANDLSFALDVLVREEKRRAAELSLRESEGRLQFLLTANPAILYSLRATGNFAATFISENVRDVLGYTPEDFVRGSDFWHSRVHPDDLPRIMAQFADSADPGSLLREYRFRHSDGSYRWMHDEMRLVKDEHGQPVSFVGYWSEITERKRMEEALRESEERYRFMADNTADMIWMGDLTTGKFTYVSPSSLRQRGYTPEEMVGQPMQDFQPPETKVWLEQRLDQRLAALATGDLSARHQTYELAFFRKDGSRIETEVSSTLMPDADGRFTRVLGVTRDITERKRAEVDLRKMSRTIEQAPLSIVITDLKGGIEYVNPCFSRITGYTFEEVRSQNPRILKSGITPPDVYEDMWHTLSAGHVWRGELHNRKKNGDIYVELAIIAPIFANDGHATHYVAIKEDITESNRVQVALRQSEERFRAIFDHAEVGMFETTPDGRITRANRHLAKMFGQPAESLLGAHWMDFSGTRSPTHAAVPPPTDPRQMRFQAGNGHRFWGLITSKRETGYANRALGHICILQDITTQVEAREALLRFNAELEAKVASRTSELASRNSQIQALLQSIPDVVLHLRSDGAIINYQPALGSPALAALSRFGPASSATSAPARLVALALPLGQRALAESQTVTSEHQIATPGDELFIELRATPSGPDEFVILVRDVTQRKHLEAETAAMLEREHQVSEMKTRFISVTSHEFRTPMAAAIGSVELLANHLDRLPPAKRQELFDRISQSLRRMTEMLDDLLTLNRMDAQRLQVQLTRIDLDAAIRNVVEEIRIGDRGQHRFEVRARGLAGVFTSDQSLLHHILSNLLSNAVRYSPAGSLVSVELRADDHRVQISVQDRGIGIPLADRTRIFEPFERGSNVGNIKGTGLGLNIVKRMTELLGGTVGVDAPEEMGIRFTVILPRNPTPTPPP